MIKQEQYSAPGRICLYGEHQDYLKLIVVPAAINLRTTITLRKNNSNKIKVYSESLIKEDHFEISNQITLAQNEFDYIRAILIILLKEKLAEKIPGFDLKIKSNIPIGSGLSSSAAILVSWLTALNDQLNLDLSKRQIADLCFKAENQILRINCGIMDQYSSSLGGIFSLDCNGPPYNITEFKSNLEGLVIGDSKIRRSANEPLTILRKQINDGLSKLQNIDNNITLKNIEINSLDNYKPLLTSIEYKRLYGVLRIRDVTLKACKELLKKKNQNLDLLGKLLTDQQTMLRDFLGVSIEKLDLMINSAMKAGALGGKLTGAGLGGCIIAFAPEKELKIAKAINKIGGEAIICKIDEDGARKE